MQKKNLYFYDKNLLNRDNFGKFQHFSALKTLHEMRVFNENDQLKFIEGFFLE